MDFVDVVVIASPFANLAPVYEVDPDADALLIVAPSNQPFAPWDPSHGRSGLGGVQSTAAAPPASRPGLRIKVSSKHLALASRVFRNKLQFGSTRAARQSDGRVHLKLAEGFDPKAASIVMNAIHGRGSKVPKSVDLEALAQIAFFVDRFQLYDAVEVYAERWIAKLEGALPGSYGRDLILWIYVSHVFRQEDVFRAATKVAATQSPGPIPTLGLPIREKIISSIDSQRQSLLAETLKHLHQTMDVLASGDDDDANERINGSSTISPCPTQHCDSLLLGELVKSLHRRGLVWPRPSRPFAGVSFAAVVAAVQGAVQVLPRAPPQEQQRRQQQQQQQEEEEVEPWYGADPSSPPSSSPFPREKRAGGDSNSSSNSNSNSKPAWGIVGGALPVTPAASPEPVYRRPGRFEGQGHGSANVHECDAWKAAAQLGALGKLGERVQGLVLESPLGYQLY